MSSDPRLVANDERDLRDVLNHALGWVNPRSVDIVTAYLTPDGFAALQGGLGGAASVRLMLGERPFMNRRGPGDVLTQPGEEHGDELVGPSESVDWYGFLEGKYPWLLLTHEERKQLLERGGDPEKQAFDLTAWERVRALADFLRREGVEVRRFLGSDVNKVQPGGVLDYRGGTHARLHAKAYMLRGDDARFSAVGSSNLTLSGLTQNIELNLTSEDPALAGRLAEWFEGKWEQSADCRDEFVRRLEECVLFGRRYTPWQVFIKSLHAAYGRFLDYGLSPEFAQNLAGFQQEGVKRCVQLLQRHWGAMLCDSVGLGKTFEGLGILGEYAARLEGRVRALVVCPAQLEGNWTQERFVQWGISGEVVTMESLPQLVDLDQVDDPLTRARLERRLHRLQQFNIVLVDESHNFRNPNTKRYRALMNIITGGVPDKRVVLLTATPINNSIWDLYHQLMLITRGDDGWYAGRAPISNLRATFKAVEEGRGGAGLLDAMMLSLVRRTRHDIRALQEAGEPVEVGGQALRFPEHEIPKAVGYSLESLYRDIYNEVVDAIEHLNFAVYQLESYGVDLGEAESAERVKQRNANFVGIMRTILLKRMESSLAALTSTVRSLVEYLDLFLERLDRGEVVTPKQAHRLRAVLGGSLPDAAMDEDEWDPRAVDALREAHAAPEDEVDRARLQAAVEEDRQRLGGLLDRLNWVANMWAGEDAPKAAQLRALLDSLPRIDANGIPTKVAIFTNYKDTAEDLFRQLGGDFDDLKRDARSRSNLKGERWLSLLTGDDDRKRREQVLQYFAPLASHRDAEPLDDPDLLARIAPYRDRRIDVLIATDVLSEGQNLQDAQYLVNYDLHWNPVRMIQRAGRIDRLFSPHEKVFIYNVMPEEGLEKLLGLVRSLSAKIETIEDAVALDASVLGEQIEARELDKVMALRAGGAQAEEVYREGERTQGLEAGLEVLNQYLEIMRQTATSEVEEIPMGVYSVREGPESGVYIMLRMPEEASGEVFWRFYPLDDLARPLTSPNDVLEIIAASQDDPRAELPDDANPFRFLEPPLRAAVEQIGAEYERAIAERAPDQLTTKLNKFLARDDLLSADSDLWKQLSDWVGEQHPRDALQRPRMRDATRVIQRLPVDAPRDDALTALRNLWAAIEAEGLDRPLPRPDSRQPSARDLELVAWELVVTPDGG